MLRWTTTIAGLLALAAACSDDPPDLGGDGGADGDTDGDADHDDYLIEGGGTAGGPIDGLLVIWFFDDPSGEPIEGVQVMVGDSAADALVGTTDADGRVVFEDESLAGPVAVHGYAEGYALTTLAGLDATYLTVQPEPADYEPAVGDPIVLGGNVSGFDAIPGPGSPSELKIAFVAHGLPREAAQSGDYEEIEQEEVDDKPVNLVIPALGGDGFEIAVHPHTGALYAFGGLLDFDTFELELTHLGALAGFDPTTEATEEIEIALDTELAEAFDVVVDVPAGVFAEIGAQVLFDLGEDGTIGLPGATAMPGDPVTVFLPDTSAAPFSGADVSVVAFAGQDEEEVVDPIDEHPTALRFYLDADLDAWSGGFTVDDMLEPAIDLAWADGALALESPSGATYLGVDVEDADGVALWSAVTFAPPVSSFALPDLPEDFGWPGFPSGELWVQVDATRGDLDPNAVVFDDIADLLESISTAALVVE